MIEMTDITLLLDESSSMHSIEKATVEGINGFILAQQKLDLPAVLTLAAFSDANNSATGGVLPLVRKSSENDPCRYLYQSKDLKKVKLIDSKEYQPCGGQTALLDAMGYLINRTGNRLSCMREKDRPNKVIIVIMTDGEENASENFTQSEVREMVQHQQSVYSWAFLFLGANQDAFKVGGGLGLRAANCMNYAATHMGTKAAYNDTSGAVADYRLGRGAAFVGKRNR